MVFYLLIDIRKLEGLICLGEKKKMRNNTWGELTNNTYQPNIIRWKELNVNQFKPLLFNSRSMHKFFPITKLPNKKVRFQSTYPLE